MKTLDAIPYQFLSVEQDHPIPLLHRRQIFGDRILLADVHLEKGCHVNVHQHESEQIAYVVSGHVIWTIGHEDDPGRYQREMRGGEVMVLPSNVPHGVDAVEDTHIIDMLSPPGPMGIDHQGSH